MVLRWLLPRKKDPCWYQIQTYDERSDRPIDSSSERPDAVIFRADVARRIDVGDSQCSVPSACISNVLVVVEVLGRM
jgi:hypothetical protein